MSSQSHFFLEDCIYHLLLKAMWIKKNRCMNPYKTYIDEIKNRDIKLFVKTKKFSILLFNGMLNYPLFLSFRHVLDLSFPSKSS